MAKYGDLSRGAELAADWLKVLEWQKKTRAQKQALYAGNKKKDDRIKVRRVPGYIRPFNNVTGLLVFEKTIPRATGQAGTIQDNITTLLTIVQADGAGRLLEVEPTEAGVIIATNVRYKFAKIHCIKVIREEPKKSRVTDNNYSKIVTESVSTAFGRATATESFVTALTKIKASAAYVAFTTAVIAGTNATNKVLITPEG